MFIDEIGKFITSDNNYFYRPAVGIIYAIFVTTYLAFNFITKNTKLTSREYQLNALAQLEEAISQDLDTSEKGRARAILNQADQDNPITRELQKLLDNMETVPLPPKGRITRFFEGIDRLYENFWNRRKSNRLVRIFFLTEAAVVLLGVLWALASNFDDLADLIHDRLNYGTWLLAGEVAAASLASLLALKGAFMLKRSRLDAFELFRRATLINLLVTEFFTFSRVEFAALPGFMVNLVLAIIIGYAIRQERRLQRRI